MVENKLVSCAAVASVSDKIQWQRLTMSGTRGSERLSKFAYTAGYEDCMYKVVIIGRNSKVD
jgi:hypothetical protein